MTKTNGYPERDKTQPNLTEMDQNFLRAARAGSLAKVVELLNAGVNINLSNPIGLTALHLASKEGYVDIVGELIRRGADFDAPTKKGNTALHIASLAGHLQVVQILLDAGANVNRQSVIGFTPLYMAAQENHLAVVDLLLKRGANQALTTEDGFTPLAVALQQGHERVVALLLERDSRSRGGMPALHIAARKDDVNSVALLLNNPEVNVNHQAQHGFTPLHIAAHYGNVNVARPLLDRGADVNYQAKNNITPLHIASKWGRIEMVRLLIAAGALVDCRTRDGLTPLHCAARSGHAELASLLIDAGANPSAKTRNGLTPLHMGAQGNNEEVAHVLILRGASVEDKTGDLLTPLHVASHCGNREVARILLENRCDANARALNGFTPLHIACKKQKIRVVELLLRYGAQIDMITESGLSPLHVAAFIGSPEIVQLLLQNGTYVDQATMRSETALHLAARNRQVEVARALIFHGATVDAKAKDDQTPLHMAVLTGHVEMVVLLLSAGANPNLTTRDAYTAMHIAAKEGHQEVIRLLLDSHADPVARTKKGFIPLHLAAKRGRVKAARQLLQIQPKSVNTAGQNNLTPLHLAAHYNHLRLVELLLDSGAEADCRAGNGYTPLHIAAKQNHLDIATLLLAHEAEQSQSGNAESRGGFTPLHLAAQEGHTDMVSLLLQHGADPNHQSKNGLTPLHLAAQENHVPIARVLLSTGADVSLVTRAGYSSLHTACHFGQLEMVRFLLEVTHATDINLPTQMGFTPLHLATQQGHSQIVSLLLEMGADGNLRNQQGLTPAHIARRQHFVTIFDILKTVTTTVVSWEEEQEELDGTLLLQQPDFMREHPLESDDEGLSPRTPRKGAPVKPTAESVASGGSFGEQKSRTGTFSLGFDTGLSVGENDDIWGQLEYMRSTLSPHETLPKQAEDQHGDENASEIVSPHLTSMLEAPASVRKDDSRMFGETIQSGGDWELEVDNVNIVRKPISTGFLVSFIVDARGGMLQAQRCSDLRFLIPPNAVNGPIRIVCRLLHPERVGSPPPINDGDGFACRVLEMGPVGVRFSAPIVLEIPHYAFLTEKNREVIVLRSDNGETWKEHPLDANDQAVQDTVNGYFDYVDSADELRKRSVHRILTYDLPQYFALITRVRQELILIGPEGGTLTSNVISEVQVVFPPGALQKKIRVGLQVHCIDQELVSRLLGARVLVSPIVTIEPRRRKFHKPITLKMPLPKSSTATGAGGLAAHSSVDSPSLRLLCSISGGTSPTVWEDITGSSPLSASKNTVSFTTTVSARLWLVDCPNTTEVVELASRVYHESLSVPYIGRFIVYGRRHHPEEAQIRCLCLTDDPIAKTLEQQEGFHLLATGPQVEVLDDHPHWIETAGNLVPVAKSEEQLQLNVRAFHENRLNMLVRVKDLTQPAVGKLAFTLHPRAVLQSLGIPQKRITVLEAHVPNGLSSSISGAVLKTTDIDEVTELSMSQHPDGLVNGFGVPSHKGDFSEVIGRLELDLSNVANSVGSDWPRLATVLGLSAEEQKMISSSYRTDSECAYAALIIWQDRAGIESTSGNKLAQFLHQIGRSDVVQACMSNVSPVTSPDERRIALRVLDSTEPSSVAPAVSGPFSETSGLGTSLDGVSSHIVGYDVTRPYISGQGETGSDNNEMEVITPVYVERRRPEVASTTVPSRPVLGSAQHADALQEVREVFVEHEVPSTPTLSSTVEQPSIDESAIVPEYVERRIPVPSRPSVQSASPTSAPGIFGGSEDNIGAEIPESDLVEMEDALIEPVYTVPCGLNEATWGPSPFAEPERRRSDDGDKMFVSSLVEPEGLRESTWGRVQSTDHSSEDEGSAGRRPDMDTYIVGLPKSPTTDLTQPPTEVVSHESDQPIASIAIPSQVPEVESGATVVVEETPVVSSLTEPLGEREATWGKPDGATENEQGTDVDNYGNDQDAPCMGGEIIQPVYIEPCGLNESTWGPSPFPEHEESGSTIVGEKPLVSSPTEAVGLRQTTSGPYITESLGSGPDAATAAADIETFEDTYENVLSEILSNRSLVQQPVSLTPIPEVSEYSLLSSSLASAHPGGSWDSADFSPSASSDGRALASRRLLHQLLQQLRSSETTNPEEDISVQGSESDRVQKRSSFASSPSETGMMDPTGGSGHLRPASSHSSLLNFLRLEASCEGSRGDLSEEERQLAFGQNETSLRDLIAGLQALHKQHLDDETSSAPLESGESSLGSQLASSSGDMERRVGAVNREMLKASEASPSVSLVASLMAAQMQHLIQSYSNSSSSVSSHQPSVHGTQTSSSDRPCRESDNGAG